LEWVAVRKIKQLASVDGDELEEHGMLSFLEDNTKNEKNQQMASYCSVLPPLLSFLLRAAFSCDRMKTGRAYFLN
jgi:hypothetical protein